MPSKTDGYGQATLDLDNLFVERLRRWVRMYVMSATQSSSRPPLAFSLSRQSMTLPFNRDPRWAFLFFALSRPSRSLEVAADGV